jgi:hypothetical protein
MAQLIKTTTTYHPNLGFTDKDTVKVKTYKTAKAALAAGKKDFDSFITLDGEADEDDFEGTKYAFGELTKSPNSAFADDTGNGIACHWYVID